MSDYNLWVPDYAWDRVVAAVEREFPNAVVTRFPELLQEHPDISEHYIRAKSFKG